jgi:hypothetical protein
MTVIIQAVAGLATCVRRSACRYISNVGSWPKADHRLTTPHSRNGTLSNASHSALISAARITFAHFSVSLVTNLPKSVGEPDSVLDRCIGLFAALLLRIRRLELEPTRQDASTAIVSGLRLLQKIKSPTNNSPVIAVLSGKPSALRAAVRSPTVVPAARTMTIVAQ